MRFTSPNCVSTVYTFIALNSTISEQYFPLKSNTLVRSEILQGESSYRVSK